MQPSAELARYPDSAREIQLTSYQTFQGVLVGAQIHLGVSPNRGDPTHPKLP